MATLLGALLKNESGGRNIPNVHQGTSSGQAQGYFQITTGTWDDFGGRKYAANPLGATYAQQAEIASKIPLKRWDKSTLNAMAATGLPIDPNRTLGENLAMHGENFGAGPTNDPNAATPQRPDAKSPQEAMDAAGPGSPYNVPRQGTIAPQGGSAPVQGPNLPYGWMQPTAVAEKPTRKDLAEAVSKAFRGGVTGMQGSSPAAPSQNMAMQEGRSSAPDAIATIDPQAAMQAQQRLQLALARLNQNQLWG